MLKASKRERMIYSVIFMWVAIGLLGIFFDSNFAELAGYYVALTGFVGAYLWGESVRGSEKTNGSNKPRKSKREIMMYVIILLWAATGSYAIIKGASILQISAYFAALTPFVGGYIIGETYRTSGKKKVEQEENR